MTRGRADAFLAYAGETKGATDAFQAKKLPAGTRPSREWERVGLRRQVPEARPERTDGAGTAGDDGAGEASWRRRLAPRHREVVRRFFATDK